MDDYLGIAHTATLSSMIEEKWIINVRCQLVINSFSVPWKVICFPKSSTGQLLLYMFGSLHFCSFSTLILDADYFRMLNSGEGIRNQIFCWVLQSVQTLKSACDIRQIWVHQIDFCVVFHRCMKCCPQRCSPGQSLFFLWWQVKILFVQFL